jgi:hypothetical protein
VPEHAQAERRLGGDMENLRLKRLDRPMDRAKRWQGKTQLFVKRQNDRPDRMDLFAIHGFAVIGIDQLNFVAALRQNANQLTQRPRDAIDLGEVRFRDQCDPHIVRRDDARVKRRASLTPKDPTRLAPSGTDYPVVDGRVPA